MSKISHLIDSTNRKNVKYLNEYTSFVEYDENCEDDRPLMEELDYDNPEYHILGLRANCSNDIFDANSKDIIKKLNELNPGPVNDFSKTHKYIRLKWIKLETAAHEDYWLPD